MYECEDLWQLHFVVLKCECLPRLEGVSRFLRVTFDFQWQPGWISAILHVAQGLTLTNRTRYSAGMAGSPRWWDLFMLSMHSFKTVGLSSCLGWVEQCYNRGELRPLLPKAQSSSFIQPPRWSVWSTASSLCCFKYCNNVMQNHTVLCWKPAAIPLHLPFVYLSKENSGFCLVLVE